MEAKLTINWFDTLDSTQEEVRRHIFELDNLSVTAALSQTSGKGQRGNRWDSEKGENLTFSILLRPGKDNIRDITPSRQFVLSKISALAVKRTLDAYGIRSRIKWPNDIYVGDRKICGMLIENSISPDGKSLEYSIIGIGLNVNQKVFPPRLMNPVSMALLLKRSIDIKEVLDTLLDHFTALLKEKDEILDGEYLGSMYRLGEKAMYTDVRSGEVFEATIKGITDDALLLVSLPSGESRRYAFKEISYIL